MQFDHFIIRPLEWDDADAFYVMVDKNRSRLEDFFTGTVSKTKTKEETIGFVLEIIKKREEKTYFPFVIVDITSQKIIGYMDLKNLDWSIPKAEMGGYVDIDVAGKGIALKAFRIFCDYCFEAFGFQKLFLRTHHSNLAARRIAESCGFELEGNIKKDYKTTAGEIVDLMYYGRLKS